MELRACPLCQHYTAEIIEEGTINKYEDGHFDNFHCDTYYISCKACGYSVHKENLLDAKLAWNMDKPTLEDLQWHINYGARFLQQWEEEQGWLPANEKEGNLKYDF